MGSFRKELLTVRQELRKAVAGLNAMVSALPSKVSSLVRQSNVVISTSVASPADFETVTGQQVTDSLDDVEEGAHQTQAEYTCSTTE